MDIITLGIGLAVVVFVALSVILARYLLRDLRETRRKRDDRLRRGKDQSYNRLFK